MPTNTQTDSTETQTSTTATAKTTTATREPGDTSPDQQDENRWVLRLEELLKVKNIDELKGELTKLASEIQSELQQFDINSHLSSDAKKRVKVFEKRYNEVINLIQKAQKDFDREFNKRVRVLKRARQDAEKQIKSFKARVAKHRNEIIKVSTNLRKKIKTKAKSKTGKKTTKSSKRKTTTS